MVVRVDAPPRRPALAVWGEDLPRPAPLSIRKGRMETDCCHPAERRIAERERASREGVTQVKISAGSARGRRASGRAAGGDGAGR